LYDAVLANPSFTFLETTRNFNADFLITYLVHPSTAVYVGYPAIWKMCSCPWEMMWMGSFCTEGGRRMTDEDCS
jgi:hypothetical protein